MDLEYDAFDEGIEPGGLRSRNEIKVLVCYLLKSIEQPISCLLYTSDAADD